jgi:3-ketosteroid 9alpha-monooxygenase subunit B
VVQETADACSFVLDPTGDHRDLFGYRPGQFCTFRVRFGGQERLRSYSMSSAPETDPLLTVTVKRVPGGAVSNWLLDHVSPGDVLEATPPAGVFCVPAGVAPVVAFCGGSGVTPVLSIAKHVLASTQRPVRMLYANRDADSVIFGEVLDRLACEFPDRLEVRHHLDTDRGYLTAEEVRSFVAGAAADALFFLCGPTPFMDLVETTLVDDGVSAERIFLERFGDVPPAAAALGGDAGTDGAPSDASPESVTIILGGETTDIAYHSGDTILQTARRGGLRAPYSCEAGDCATCMALLHQGSVTMRNNNALTPDEIDEGWVLTCQAVPEGARVTVEYESF